MLVEQVQLAGNGAGMGYGTWHRSIPDEPSLAGQQLWMQWFVLDPAAPRGVAKSPIARITLF